MLRRRTQLILVSAAVLIAALAAWNRPPSFEVIGELSAAEVAQIAEDVRKISREPILEDGSWRSVRAVPERILRRLRNRVHRIERRTREFVVVITATSRDPERDGYQFWSVFLEPPVPAWNVKEQHSVPGSANRN